MTVFDERDSEYFGFEEDEVAQLAAYYGVADLMTEIKSWYDGYDFGGRKICNPWSVLNDFEHDCVAKPFWLDTSSNARTMGRASSWRGRGAVWRLCLLSEYR